MGKKIVAFLCVFMYFGSPYRIAGLEMPEVIGLIALIMQFLLVRKIKFPQHYVPFFLYMLFIPPLASLSMGMPGNYIASFIPIALLLYTSYFAVLLPNANYAYVLRFYRLLVWVAVSFFWIQELSFFATGWRPSLYVPFLEMHSSNVSAQSLSDLFASFERSQSFFLEPSHFVEYIIPYFCIILASCLKSKKYSFELVLLVITILWAQSGSGYLAVVALAAYIFFWDKSIKPSFKIGVCVLLLFLVYSIYSFFRENELVASVAERITEFSPEVEQFGAHSGFLRIWRGYFIYDSLPVVNKILGTGVGCMEYVTSLMRGYDPINGKSFLNGIQTLLINGGLLGTFLFGVFFMTMFKKCNVAGKYVLVAMIALFFVEHMLFTPKMFLSILVAYSVTIVGNTYGTIVSSQVLKRKGR